MNLHLIKKIGINLLNGAATVSWTQIKALPWPRNTVILLQHGALKGSRTLMVLLPLDFESSASTNSAMKACNIDIIS